MGSETTTGATRIAEVAATRAVEAAEKSKGPSPLALAMIAGLLGMVPVSIGGLVSYGHLSAQLDGLEARLSRKDVLGGEAPGKMLARLDSMAAKLEAIQGGVLRLEGREGHDRRDERRR